jgi:hypothetical protein
VLLRLVALKSGLPCGNPAAARMLGLSLVSGVTAMSTRHPCLYQRHSKVDKNIHLLNHGVGGSCEDLLAPAATFLHNAPYVQVNAKTRLRGLQLRMITSQR